MEMPLSGYDWVIIEEKNKAPQHIIQKYGQVIGQLLYNRKSLYENLSDESSIYPTLKNLIPPSLFNSLEHISFQLAESIKKRKRIVVYGDYDADGITSTSLLVNFFRDIGVKVNFYIPSRFSEGYGLNKEAIKQISKNADVLIVVDSGTSAYEELLYAKQLGLKVFVFDHHEPKNKEWQEENIFILNPKLHDNLNPLFKHLASVGISFYVIIMLRRLLNLDIKLKPYLDIVAIGTVADVVPLSLINRIFVKNGIEVINKRQRVGIQKLLEQASLNKEINSFDIGFVIAPRLNASGRLDSAAKAVKLLTTTTAAKASALSSELDFLNRKRQKITEIVFQESQRLIKNENISHAIVVGSKKWHSGVVGIVAGRLVEKYRVPSVVLSIDNGKAVGSARSVSKINIYEALKNSAHLFERFGGHSSAAGFTIPTENINKFKYELQESIKNLEKKKPWVVREIDMEVPLEYWNVKRVKELSILEPFGEGNPFPVFLARHLKIDDFVTIGNMNQHLKFWFRDKKGNVFSGLWWGGTEYIKKLSVGMDVDIVYTPKLSNWNSQLGIDFILKDMKINK